MATITIRVPDEELANIDEIAGPNNRTQFMLEAARRAVAQRRRQRLVDEVGRLCAESAEENLAVVDDWSVTMADGIE
jgi:predicted transcriptional regulator